MIPTMPKRFSNNGAITRYILKAVKMAKEGEMNQLRNAVESAMMSFPLSSNKMIWDNDLEGMDKTKKEVVLAACVASDNRKAIQSISYSTGLGMPEVEARKGILPFGRSTI